MEKQDFSTEEFVEFTVEFFYLKFFLRKKSVISTLHFNFFGSNWNSSNFSALLTLYLEIQLTDWEISAKIDGFYHNFECRFDKKKLRKFLTLWLGRKKLRKFLNLAQKWIFKNLRKFLPNSESFCEIPKVLSPKVFEPHCTPQFQAWSICAIVSSVKLMTRLST